MLKKEWYHILFPCINQNLEINKEQNGKISIFNRKSAKTFVIGVKEYNVLITLDGTKSIDDISKVNNDFSIDEIKYLIEFFKKIGFLNVSNEKTKINFIKVKKPILNGNKLINPNKFLWQLLNNIILYLSIPILLIGIGLNFTNFNDIFLSLNNAVFTPSMIIIIPITIILLSLHELGHAVVARCKKVNVPEIGIMLYWFIPCAYTNLSGIVFLEKRYTRIIVLFAGILVNVLLLGIGLITMSFISTYSFIYDMLLWFVFSSFSIILLNLVIFIKLDGYFILEEFINIKNLRKKSINYLNNVLNKRSKIMQNTTNNRIKYLGITLETNTSSLENYIYILYFVFSCIYITFILLSLISSFL